MRPLSYCFCVTPSAPSLFLVPLSHTTFCRVSVYPFLLALSCVRLDRAPFPLKRSQYLSSLFLLSPRTFCASCLHLPESAFCCVPSLLRLSFVPSACRLFLFSLYRLPFLPRFLCAPVYSRFSCVLKSCAFLLVPGISRPLSSSLSLSPLSCLPFLPRFCVHLSTLTFLYALRPCSFSHAAFEMPPILFFSFSFPSMRLFYLFCCSGSCHVCAVIPYTYRFNTYWHKAMIRSTYLATLAIICTLS